MLSAFLFSLCPAAGYSQPMLSTHSLPIRIYYEDTDAGGVVYYANYLKFAERARTEWLRSLGIDQSQLRRERGVFFVVRHCEIDYHAPARLDDALIVETHLQQCGNASIAMAQNVRKDGGSAPLADISVTLVCVNEQMRPTRIPPEIRTPLRSE